PRSRLADERDEPLALVDGVTQLRQRLAVAGVQVEKLRIGCEIERLLTEAEERQVHPPPALGRPASPRRGNGSTDQRLVGLAPAPAPKILTRETVQLHLA